jgi:restriction system protein
VNEGSERSQILVDFARSRSGSRTGHVNRLAAIGVLFSEVVTPSRANLAIQVIYPKCPSPNPTFADQTMPIPDFQTLMLPFLKRLADGQERRMKELVDMLAEDFAVTAEERRILLPSKAAPLFANRVAWTKTHLKNAGLVENHSRGLVRLSPLGRTILAQLPDRIDMRFLKQFDSYRDFTGGAGTRSPSIGTEDVCTAEVSPAESPPLELLESAHEQLNRALAEELLTKLMEGSPQFFERVVVQLLEALGYGGEFGSGEVTSYARDGGIDGIIREDKLGLDTICVQAKRWQGTVSRPTIQSFVGSMDMIRAKKGVIVTTSHFTRDASDYLDRIEGKRVVLIDGERLTSLMIEHNVGVSVVETYQVKEISNDFFDEL